MNLLSGQVWCEKHGDVHAASNHPYDGPPTEHDKNGCPVWLRYADFDEDGNEVEGRRGEKSKVETRTVPMEPDCAKGDWRKLWAGGPVE